MFWQGAGTGRKFHFDKIHGNVRVSQADIPPAKKVSLLKNARKRSYV